MRLWSLHPRYLDPKGLVALWREGLLARRVLRGRTRGYRHHPQLERFREHPSPLVAIDAYLTEVWAEGRRRGYRFDGRKIRHRRAPNEIAVTSGQAETEWEILKQKLAGRAPVARAALEGIDRPALHPIFDEVPGPRASWEKAVAGGAVALGG